MSEPRNINTTESDGSRIIPPALYPPVLSSSSSRYPSTQVSQQLRSALAPAPQFYAPLNATTATGSTHHHYHRDDTDNRAESRGRGDRDNNHRAITESSSSSSSSAKQPCRVQFCSRDVLACINHHHHHHHVEDHKNESDSNVRSNRTVGPILLELRQLQLTSSSSAAPETKPGFGRLATTVPLAYSRSNPSLGTSLASTCLHVLPNDDDSSSSTTTTLPRIATGLTTGAVCIHSFQEDTSGTTTSSSWLPSSMELYHSPRQHHRPATAVRWRPNHTTHASSSHVAVGLIGNAATLTSTTSGAGGATAASTTLTMTNTNNTTNNNNNSNNTVPSTSNVGGGGGGSGGTDRDYCCFIWDVEHQQGNNSTAAANIGNRTRTNKSTALFKLSYQTGVSSLAWVLEGGQTLAVGGQMRNLHLYDVRMGITTSQQQAPMSVYAHNFGVHGIESDPYRPWQLATFCKAVNEPVKLWDARMMDSVLSEIKISGRTTTNNNTNNEMHTATVFGVQWSTAEAGKIAIGVSGGAIYEYDTSTSVSRPSHVHTTYTQDSIVDFCMYPFAAPGPSTQTTHRTTSSVLAELFPNRLVTVTGERTIVDIARHALAPIALSPRDGRVVHGFGHTLWIGSPSIGPAAMESLRIQCDEDISSTMMRRARCQRVAKYSMVASSNIKVLAEDGLVADTVTAGTEGMLKPSRESLLRLWSWIERVEALCADAEDLCADGLSWQAKGLKDAGAWQLIHGDNGKDDDQEVYSEQLACTTYDSPGRRAALTSCGWAGKFSLINVLGECESLGEYERSAALAVWHGEIEAAVGSLERGADDIRLQLGDMRKPVPSDGRVSLQYAETLELIALCIAGYRGGDMKSSSADVWRRSCAKLMQRDVLVGGLRSTSRVAYLRSVLTFLMTLGSEKSHTDILIDSTLSLCDRVGFACRFLDRDHLVSFLEQRIQRCQSTGNAEGITITGLEKQGVAILQAYVDKYSDVQTAALVTSRVIFPADFVKEKQVSEEWLDCYRSLLNSWQMWESRASFDVDRAELLRQIKARQVGATTAAPSAVKTSTLQPSLSTRNRNNSVSLSRKQQGPRPLDPEIQAGIPCQLDARCNYCNSPLGLKSQDTHASQWLSKMKPVLSCCPQCRKPLPRCSICMLSLGALNPYMELTKDRSHHHRNSNNNNNTTITGPLSPPLVGDLTTLGNLPFAEWFTWCMRCKHGGHAHHLVGWFAKHETCPVSGCHCSCQFDGIQKLSRPALSQRSVIVSGDGEGGGRSLLSPLNKVEEIVKK